MGRHVKVVLALVVAGVLAMLAYRVLAPLFEERQQLSTSDAGAAKGKLVIGVDNWIGYFPLCSPEMRRRMRQSGYALQCVDDNADYPARMRALEKEELQFAVATVDSYLLNGRAVRYPGSIVAVIDESKGGDAIVAWRDKATSLEDLKGKRLKVAYTPGSPSEHLLKSMAVHFDIPVMRERTGDWRVHSAGSEDALRRLKQRQVELAVLWEPDVSRALSESGIVKLIGTEDTEKLIVDILLVSRDFSARDPEAVKTLLRNYFLTLKQFRSNPQSLNEEAQRHTGLPKDKVEAMLRGVSWKSLTDNARSWFGVRVGGRSGAEGLIDAILGASQVLLDSGDFSASPLPDDDPYRLTHSQFIAELYAGGGIDPQQGVPEAEGEDSLTRVFAPLSDAQWGALREVGTLKVRPIIFQSGTANLTLDGKREVDRAVENLKHYPNFRVLVKGHTNRRGDPEANRELSRQRAEAVTRYLSVTYGIDANRMLAQGFGGDQPLPRQPGESNRAYDYRLQRVEMFLAAEDF